jgi:hypothetical protein
MREAYINLGKAVSRKVRKEIQSNGGLLPESTIKTIAISKEQHDNSM